MLDPHVHAEKTLLGLGHARMRELFIEATREVLGVALVPDMPKTVATGCGLRRPLAATSTVPEKITCLACREWGRKEHERQAESAGALLSWMEADPESFQDAGRKADITPEQLAELVREHRAMAARYA